MGQDTISGLLFPLYHMELISGDVVVQCDNSQASRLGLLGSTASHCKSAAEIVGNKAMQVSRYQTITRVSIIILTLLLLVLILGCGLAVAAAHERWIGLPIGLLLRTPYLRAFSFETCTVTRSQVTVRLFNASRPGSNRSWCRVGRQEWVLYLSLGGGPGFPQITRVRFALPFSSP